MNYSIFLEETEIEAISLHRIGNKARDEGYKTTDRPLNPSYEVKEILSSYFLSSFKLDKLYKLDNEHDVSMNELYQLCISLFDKEVSFHDFTKEIAKLLYNKSNHVKIKSGELYVCQLDNIIFDDEIVQGIGIFKSEDKETFLKLKMNDQQEFDIDFQEGSNTSNIDKGCIILRTERFDGFRVLHLDKRSADAQFFKDDFLSITEVKDHHYHTSEFLKLFKQFADRFYKQESKLQKAHFLQCCKDYFQHYKEFNFEEFKEVVFDHGILKLEAIDSLGQTISEAIESDTIEETYFEEGFQISKKSAEVASRKLKSIIKLDTQMELKIQSSQCLLNSYIETGFDQEKEMNYYKVYFQNEK